MSLAFTNDPNMANQLKLALSQMVQPSSSPNASKSSPKGGGSTYREGLDLDDPKQVAIALMSLRKPTELKKVIDSVPKPLRAVPKNGLPIWYKLGLECKLPVPKMPQGKIVFSRGKMGEDVRRIGLGPGVPSPTFDLTDPYCYNVSYDYVAVHDPHLKFYFRQKQAANRMKATGFATKDGRAVCSLKEFNTYRKYLYNRFMDRIHKEMMKLDERAKDDLTLKKVEADVARRSAAFIRTEKAREHLEKHARIYADEIAEKKRQAEEQEKKIEARMRYLIELNKKNRKERAARILEKETRIKQRVQAAAEMELRRKITMIRQWRSNEKRRLLRMKMNRDEKLKKMEDDAEQKWQRRVSNQNQKIEEENILLKLYVEDMHAASYRRLKKAQIYAYNNDLKLQSIRITNLRLVHGSAKKQKRLVRKMGVEFEKSKRGAKGMSKDLAQKMARQAMANAGSTAGDTLMILGQARARMDLETILPQPPIHILDNILENAIVEFARRRVHLLLRDVERVVYARALSLFLQYHRPSVASNASKRSKAPRYSVQLTTAVASEYAVVQTGHAIVFGDVSHVPPEEEYVDFDLKRSKDRPPTPVPSLTKLAEVTFTDKIEDLPDPVTMPYCLPERKKLLEMVNSAAKLLSRTVSAHVLKGMDLTIAKVTLPRLRAKLEWGEAVEGLANAVVNNRIKNDCDDLRRASEYLSYRILRELQFEMKKEKQRQKSVSAGGGSFTSEPAPQTDFYVPDKAASLPESSTTANPNTTLQFSPSTIGGQTAGAEAKKAAAAKPNEAVKPNEEVKPNEAVKPNTAKKP